MPRQEQLSRLVTDSRAANRTPDPEDASLIDVSSFEVISPMHVTIFRSSGRFRDCPSPHRF